MAQQNVPSPLPLRRFLPRRTLITAALAAPALWRANARAQSREKVELLIDWKPSPTYAGFFLAQQTGAFERAGSTSRS